MENAHAIRQGAERVCAVPQRVPESVDEIVVGLEETGGLVGEAALVGGQAFECGFGGGVLAGFSVEEPRVWVVGAWLRRVAEAVAAELGVVVDVMDVP